MMHFAVMASYRPLSPKRVELLHINNHDQQEIAHIIWHRAFYTQSAGHSHLPSENCLSPQEVSYHAWQPFQVRFLVPFASFFVYDFQCVPLTPLAAVTACLPSNSHVRVTFNWNSAVVRIIIAFISRVKSFQPMQTAQYPDLAPCTPDYRPYLKTPVLFHLNTLASALRLSLALYLTSSTEARNVRRPSIDLLHAEMDQNPVEQALILKNSLPLQKAVRKIKYHQKGNFSKLTHDPRHTRETPSHPKQECHSSDLTLREEVQKPSLPIRKSKKVARTSLFLKNRETRGSMKTVRGMGKGKDKWLRLSGAAVIETVSVISMKQRREGLLRRRVSQWRVSKQEGAAFGREYRYLLE